MSRSVRPPTGNVPRQLRTEMLLQSSQIVCMVAHLPESDKCCRLLRVSTDCHVQLVLHS